MTEKKNNTNDKEIFLILWFPHSGGRWLNRSLLPSNSKIYTSEFYLPFLTHSTDMILNLDRTSQVHKARSLKELETEFEIVKDAVRFGRIESIKQYFSNKIKYLNVDISKSSFGGALSPGAPEPLIPDLKIIHEAWENLKIIHLVRNPIDCFLSMKSRSEMDGDPFKIGSLWTGFNASIRDFYSNKSMSKNYISINYENLVCNTENTLKDICEFLNVAYESTMLKELTKYHGRNKGSDLNKILSQKDLNIIQELTKSETAHYNI